MVGQGRDSQEDNNLFFTCGLIDYISRKTMNKRADVVNQLGEDRIRKIYELADAYHCENIDSVSETFIAEANIRFGSFDNVSECGYAVPSHWDIGKVYRRLIRMVAEYKKINRINALIEVYNSFVSSKIDDYNSSFYYENPNYIFECYKQNEVL